MTEPVATTSGRLAAVARFALVAYCYLMMSGLITFFVFTKTPVLESSARAGTVSMIEGSANKPFVFRRLLPAAAGAIYYALPDSVDEMLSEKAKAPGAQSVITFLQWKEQYVAYYLITACLVFACFVGFMLSLRWIAKLLYPGSRWLCDAAPVLAMLLLPPTFLYAKYIYDAPTLFLVALAFGAILARKNVLFYIAFVAAVFNKETSILLIPLFAMAYWGKRGKGPISVHAAAQLLIWAGITFWLRWIYRANPGVSVEYHLFEHNLALGYLDRKLLALVFVGILALVARFGWYSSAFNRRALLVTLIPLVALTMMFGWVEEMRDYLEALPMLFALLLPGVRSLYLPSSAAAKDPREAASPV